MGWIDHVAKNAPEIFLLLAVALGTFVGRVRIRGFAIGAPACILIVAVILGQFGTVVFPPVLKSILFGLFVYTIGYRSGPEFFASLSLQTLTQVVLPLVMAACGLAVILTFAYTLHLDTGTAAGLGAGSLTQTAMMGTALGALETLGLSGDELKQQQTNIAAGYAVTYILGYILVLIFVPFVAPWLMGVDLKEEAKKLEAALSRGAGAKPGNLLYRKFQVRAFQVSSAAGRTVKEIEAQIGRRAVVERILRSAGDIQPSPNAKLHSGDEILLAGPSAVIVSAAPMIGPEIEGEHVMRSVPGEVVEVYVTARHLHGRTLKEIVDELGDATNGVFLRALTRRGQEVPVTPNTRIYVGDVMTLVALNRDLKRLVPMVGQLIRASDRTDIAFLTMGLAVGLLVGLLSFSIGPIPLTLGGGGGALVAGLVCGWIRTQRPTIGAFPRSRPAIPHGFWTGWIHCRHRACKWAGRFGRHSSEWARAVRRGRSRHADALDCWHAVRASGAADEPGRHLRRSRRRDDRRRRRDHQLRGRGEPDPGAWRGRALRGRECHADSARTDHCWTDVCRLSGEKAPVQCFEFGVATSTTSAKNPKLSVASHDRRMPRKYVTFPGDPSRRTRVPEPSSDLRRLCREKGE